METYNCLYCNKTNKVRSNISNKYCNNKCQGLHTRDNRIKEWIETGKTWKGPNIAHWAKAYILERDNNKCSECNITEWNNKPIVFDIDHIDGNPKNHSPDNLRIICPNCHSQTSTYKNKNYGSGRKQRRQSV